MTDVSTHILITKVHVAMMRIRMLYECLLVFACICLELVEREELCMRFGLDVCVEEWWSGRGLLR